MSTWGEKKGVDLQIRLHGSTSIQQLYGFKTAQCRRKLPYLVNAIKGRYSMNLNLPILDMLKHSRNILIAGMGGGFDVLCGLPIFFELEALGYDVHLANLSFSDIAGLTDGEALTDTLVGVTTE